MKTKIEIEPIIKLWKELNIDYAEFEFDCGGDSMNDTTLTFTNKDGEIISNDILDCYFESEVYNNVSFYEASDGYYMGENGVVEIKLDEDISFSYSKNSTSEFNEGYTEIADMVLNEAEATMVNKIISNMNGNGWGDTTINYKGDFILSDEDDEMVESIANKITDFCLNYEIEDAEGEEMEDSVVWTTNSDDISDLQVLQIEDNKIKLHIRKEFRILKENDL
jgi:hypothetical protein